jgi:cell division protein FtsQ
VSLQNTEGVIKWVGTELGQNLPISRMVPMTGIASISREDLAQRRRQLQQRRRLRTLRAGWRVVALLALVVAVAWSTTLPIWVLRSPAQIQVKGNHYIPTATVQSLVPLTFPQSLWRVEPESLAAAIKAKAPLASVSVQRQLIPPALVVQIQERYPVAIAFPATRPNATTSTQTGSASTATPLGLLDLDGNLISSEHYTTLGPGLKLPNLKVVGNPEQYRWAWSRLYSEIARSAVKISEIDWQDVNNLILKTELGTVRIGPYSSQFNYQLSLLDRMRQLPKRVDMGQVALINLLNPQVPTVQFSKSLETPAVDSAPEPPP